MKLVKKANKNTIKISKSEWLSIGSKANWLTSSIIQDEETEYLLGLWERVWPKAHFSSEEEWLEHCRLWWPRLPLGEKKETNEDY